MNQRLISFRQSIHTMIDLHCHSNISDGTLTPTQVVELAVQNGCEMLALTDHDNIDGLEEAKQAASQNHIRFINGVEISVTWRSRTIHIVGLNFDPKNQQLQSILQHLRQGRLNRLHKIAAKLEKKAFTTLLKEH